MITLAETTTVYRILLADRLGPVALEGLRRNTDVVVDYRPELNESELRSALPGYDALIVRDRTRVSADMLAAAERLKVLGCAGADIDHIDLDAATRQGIVVLNTPGADSIAQAELTMALMLAACRHLPQAHVSVTSGVWQPSEFTGIQLFHRTLGIIGFSQVGRLVAERAKSFGMDVLVFDPHIPEEAGRESGVLLVELDELLAQSDVITLHSGLMPDTESMINHDTIQQMKDGVILVNVSSANLLDEGAVYDALETGKIATLAVDSFSAEPPSAHHPLIGLPNVIHLPRLASGTIEAERDVGVRIAAQVVAALRGSDFTYAVNMPFDSHGDFAAIRPYLQLAEILGRLHVGLSDKPIKRVELEVRGDVVSKLVRAIAAAVLKGILDNNADREVNYINAPILAHERGVGISQTVGINSLDYPNLVGCRALWDGGERLLAGVLFGGSEPRIVQVDEYHLEARPEGVVLIMQNRDVPGVIGQVGTILAAYETNIGEWRLGRDKPGGEALSFINLDSEPSETVIRALGEIKAVTQIRVVRL